MSGFKPQYFDAGATLSAIDKRDHAIGAVDINSVPVLRYSSPLPWVLALMIGVMMWVFLAWLISGYL
jgi:hypothetical protein